MPHAVVTQSISMSFSYCVVGPAIIHKVSPPRHQRNSFLIKFCLHIASIHFLKHCTVHPQLSEPLSINTVCVMKTSNIPVVKIQITLQVGHHLVNYNEIHENYQAVVHVSTRMHYTFIIYPGLATYLL